MEVVVVGVLWAVLTACWAVLVAMAPYLLLGFLVAGVLSVVISPAWVERHLGGRGLTPVLKASLLGVPLPLCSCGVIPVAVALRKHGASKGATAAFLLSTPQTGVDSIAVTYALLGPFLAVYRPLAALVTGLIGGTAVHALDSEHPEPAVEAEDVDRCCADSAGSCDGGRGEGDRAGCGCEEDGCTCHDQEARCGCEEDGCSCHDDAGSECCGTADERENAVVRALRHGFLTLPRDIGPALLVGVVLSGLLSVVVAPQTLQHYLGTGLLPVLAAMAIGVPLYVCATASVPIALGLVHAGLSPGAALAFLISGPATNGAALAALWKVLGRRAAFLYLGTVVLVSVASGLLVDSLMTTADIPASAFFPVHAGAVVEHGPHHGARASSLFAIVCAVVLCGVTAAAMWPRRRRAAVPEGTGEVPEAVTLELKVSGMHCEGCASNLTDALTSCSGVSAVEVDLESGIAHLRGSHIAAQSLLDAVSSLGFTVENPDVLRLPRA